MTAKPKNCSMPLANKSIQNNDNRTVKFSKVYLEKPLRLSEEKMASLVFQDCTFNFPIRIPLGKVSPIKKGDSIDLSPSVLIPLIPYVYVENNYTTRQKTAIPIRNGWLYIFKDGYLWRELEVLDKGRLRDVNLEIQQNGYKDYKFIDIDDKNYTKDTLTYNTGKRTATGEIDTRVVVPHIVHGITTKIEMCFSETQWSWSYIFSMGGMDPDKKNDPRVKETTREYQRKYLEKREEYINELKKDAEKRKKEIAAEKGLSDSKRAKMIKNVDILLTTNSRPIKERRYDRFTQIKSEELDKYKESWKNFNTDSTLAPIAMDITEKDNTKLKSIHSKSKVAKVYLEDPIGIFEEFKSKHLHIQKRTEELAVILDANGYNLAKLINSILDSEVGSFKAHYQKSIENELQKIHSQGNVSTYFSNKLSGREKGKLAQFKKEYEKDKDLEIKAKELFPEHYKRYIEKERNKDNTILALIDKKRVDENIKKCSEEEIKLEKEANENRNTLAELLNFNYGRTNGFNQFDYAMMDYFESEIPAYKALGLARMAYFTEGFSYRTGMGYLGTLCSKENLIGQYLNSDNFMKSIIPLLYKLERGELSYKKINEEDLGIRVDPEWHKGFLLKSVKTFSKTIGYLGKYKLADPAKNIEGMKWIQTKINSFLEGSAEKFVINIRERRIDKMFEVEINYNKSSYNYKEPPNTISKKVQQFDVDNELPSETFKRLKKSKIFSGLMFTISSFNTLTTIQKLAATLSSGKKLSTKEKLKVAKDMTDVMEYGAKLAKGYAKIASEIYGSLNDKNQVKITKALAQIKSSRNSRRRSNSGKQRKLSKIQLTAANKEADRLYRQIARWTSWTQSISSTLVFLDIVGASVALFLSLSTFANEKTFKGKLLAGILVGTSAIQLMTAVTTLSKISNIKNAGLFLRGLRAVGSATPIGFAIFILTLIVESVVGDYLEELSLSKINQALKYCYFGKDPYAKMAGINSSPHKANMIGIKVRSFSERTWWNVIFGGNEWKGIFQADFSAECAEIYRCLHSYDGYAKLGVSEVDPSVYLASGTVKFTRFITGKSKLDVTLRVIYNTSTNPSKIFLVSDLKYSDTIKNGDVTEVTFAHRIPKSLIHDISSIIVTTSLDIFGDTKFIVPKQLNTKDKKGKIVRDVNVYMMFPMSNIKGGKWEETVWMRTGGLNSKKTQGEMYKRSLLSRLKNYSDDPDPNLSSTSKTQES